VAKEVRYKSEAGKEEAEDMHGWQRKARWVRWGKRGDVTKEGVKETAEKDDIETDR
jgi:hypothetical protein